MAAHIAIAFSSLAEWGTAENPSAARMNPAGLTLYKALCRERPVILVVDGVAVDIATTWMSTHLLTTHAMTLPNPDLTSPAEGRSVVIEVLRKFRVEFSIETDTDLAARMLHNGIPTLLLSNPFYDRPEFRPDAEKSVAPWESIVAELDAQRALLAKDTRIADDDVLGTRFED